MYKGIEWLKDKIRAERERLALSPSEGQETMREFILNNGKHGALVDVLELIDQLDEPEVLSQEWIKDNTQLDMNPTSRVVPAFLLENLLVPKQEEVDRAYKDAYEKGKEYNFYKGYLEGLADKEGEPEKVVVPHPRPEFTSIIYRGVGNIGPA